ncbi:MAG TPA: hypothetical protein VLV84_01400 [Candidatus Acidoferrales bacterium]|nr:hypothetical protein [Candidatus Acidoferrales bacterium]
MVLLEEQAENFEKSNYRERPINFSIPLTVKVNFPILQRLDRVAEFKNRKPATMAREILLDGIASIERDPWFKKFMRDKERNREREAKLENKQ